MIFKLISCGRGLEIVHRGVPGGNSCFLGFLLILCQCHLPIEDRGETVKLEGHGYETMSRLRRLLYGLPYVQAFSNSFALELRKPVDSFSNSMQLLSLINYFQRNVSIEDAPELYTLFTDLRDNLVETGKIKECNIEAVDNLLRTVLLERLRACVTDSLRVQEVTKSLEGALPTMVEHFQEFRDFLRLPGYIDEGRINEQSDLSDMLRLAMRLVLSEKDRLFEQIVCHTWSLVQETDKDPDGYSDLSTDPLPLSPPNLTVLQLPRYLDAAALTREMNLSVHGVSDVENQHYIRDGKVCEFSHTDLNSCFSSFPLQCAFVMEVGPNLSRLSIPHYLKVSSDYSTESGFSEAGQWYKIKAIAIRTGSRIQAEAGVNGGHYKTVVLDGTDWKIVDTLFNTVESFDIRAFNAVEATQFTPVYERCDRAYEAAESFKFSFPSQKLSPVSVEKTTPFKTHLCERVAFHSGNDLSPRTASRIEQERSFLKQVSLYRQSLLTLLSKHKFHLNKDKPTKLTRYKDTQAGLNGVPLLMADLMRAKKVKRYDIRCAIDTLNQFEGQVIASLIEAVVDKWASRQNCGTSLFGLMGEGTIFNRIFSQCLGPIYFLHHNEMVWGNLKRAGVVRGFVEMMRSFTAPYVDRDQATLQPDEREAYEYCSIIQELLSAILETDLYRNSKKT